VVRPDYWNVTDVQVVAKTGKTLREWDAILDQFEAQSKPSNEVVAHLQGTHGVPRYWARTLATRYSKQAAQDIAHVTPRRSRS
jgi:hypothetical protein